MRSAADFTREQLIKNLPPGFPVDSYVGLIETSIGKMVPIMPLAEVEKDPLVVFAEPYNTLILDGKGFKSPIPDVKGWHQKTISKHGLTGKHSFITLDMPLLHITDIFTILKLFICTNP